MASVINQESPKKDAVRIKVIQHCTAEVDSQCCRFSVDLELTSFEILKNLITRAFDLKRDFQTCYLARDDRLPEACWLPLLSDFDLDLAFQRSSDPYLLIKVEISSSGPWDTSALDLSKFSLPDLPKNNYTVKLPGIFKEKMEKTLSIVQKALNWNEEELDPQPPRSPLTDSEFQRMLDTLGTLKDSRELRLRVYSGGIEPSLRKVVWKHLLNVYPENLTGKQRMDYMKEKTQDYYQLRQTWQDHLETSNKLSAEVKYTTNMVRKDVLRTDRHHPFFKGSDDSKNIKALFNILTTYALNHPVIGYCQGMSDLASPLFVTMKDEAQAYVCFCALMLRLNSNFHIDGDAMTLKFQHVTEALIFYDSEFYSYLQQHQADDLLFCYRWLLLEFKREFAFDDAQIMLEVLWSSLPPNPPQESLPLSQVLFNPTTICQEASPSPSTPRQNHYGNVCALRRQRSTVSSSSAECLTATVHHRRTVSVDFHNVGNQNTPNHTMLQPIVPEKLVRSDSSCSSLQSSDLGDVFSSPIHLKIKDEVISPDNSPVTATRKIKDLKEFRNLTSKAKSPTDNTAYNQDFHINKTENHCFVTDIIGSKRCFSDSDADLGLALFDSEDIDVWQNPMVSPDVGEQNIEIVAQEERPSVIKVQESNCEVNSNLNSCEEARETGWQVSVSKMSPPTLPPPDEFGGGNPFLMFLCVTFLMQHRQYIMQHNLDHNELAMHFDKMVRKHNVNKVLCQARKMFEVYLDFSTKGRSKPTPSTITSVDQSC